MILIETQSEIFNPKSKQIFTLTPQPTCERLVKIKVFPFKRQSENVIVVIYKYLRSRSPVWLANGRSCFCLIRTWTWTPKSTVLLRWAALCLCFFKACVGVYIVLNGFLFSLPIHSFSGRVVCLCTLFGVIWGGDFSADIFRNNFKNKTNEKCVYANMFAIFTAQKIDERAVKD